MLSGPDIFHGLTELGRELLYWVVAWQLQPERKRTRCDKTIKTRQDVIWLIWLIWPLPLFFMFSNEMQWRWQFDSKWNFEGFEHLKVLTHLCRYAHVASCPLAALQPRRSLRLLGLWKRIEGKFKTTDANIEYSFIILHTWHILTYTHIQSYRHNDTPTRIPSNSELLRIWTSSKDGNSLPDWELVWALGDG